jgi:hypothetical protein
VTLTRTFKATAGQRTVYSAHAECTDAQTPSMVRRESWPRAREECRES